MTSVPFATLFPILLTLIPLVCCHQYTYVHAYLTWSDAMEYCMQHYGTTLATITNDNDINTATNIIREDPIELDTEAWIGLKDIHNNNTYSWADQSDCKLLNDPLCTDYWAQSLMNGPCVYHNIDQFEYGFHSHDCSDLQPFICNTHTPVSTDTNNDIQCNYLQISGHGFPIHKCAPYTYEGRSMSYRYECGNDGIVLNYWFDDNVCGNGNEPSLVLNVSNITDYECEYENDMNNSCLDTMDIKWYLSDSNEQMSCVQNKDYNYIETRIINQCLPMNATHYLQWQCFEDYYIGLVYSDNICSELKEQKRFEFGQCVDGLVQFHSCDGTTVTPDPQMCDFVNFDGIARRVNVCHSAKLDGIECFYKFECDMSGNGHSPIIRKWYNDKKCMSEAWHIQWYDNSDIIDYQCSVTQNICAETDVLIVKTYDSQDCAINSANFTVSDVLINQCFRDDNNGSKIIECNARNDDFGYIIKYFEDLECNNTETMSIDRYSESECVDNELEHILWCNGPNMEFVHTNKCEYIIDNEYKNIGGNLVHSPNKCTMFKMAGGYFSNEYVCSYTHNQMDEIWYKGTQCDRAQVIATYNHTQMESDFNCDQSIEMDDGCDSLDKLLMLRWYKKDPLNGNGDCMKKEGFIHDNIVIVNECVSEIVNDETVYMQIDCDVGLDWFEINYYKDFECKQYSKFQSLRFGNEQCYDGDILVIMACQGKKRRKDSFSSSHSHSHSHSHSYSSSSD